MPGVPVGFFCSDVVVNGEPFLGGLTQGLHVLLEEGDGDEEPDQDEVEPLER